MNHISVPKPCHENWDNMQPEAQGKHCLACCKTVVDFSTWEQEDILNYLQNKNGERVCGRFDASQLQPLSQHNNVLPVILKSNVSFLKKIAAIIFICFGVMTGAESYGQGKIVGKPAHPKPATTMQQTLGEPAIDREDTVKTHTINIPKLSDSTAHQPQIMGMVAPQPKIIRMDSVNKKDSIKKKKIKR